MAAFDTNAVPYTSPTTLVYAGFTGIQVQVASLLTWTAQRSGTTTVRVDFARSLRSLAATSVTTNYSISGPTTITVTGVSFTPGNSFVLLTISGTFTALATYTLSLVSQTAQSGTDDQYNTTTPYSFIGNFGGGSADRFNQGLN